MITFTILMTLLLILGTVAATLGAGLAVIFGDLVVCGLLIWGIVQLFRGGK